MKNPNIWENKIHVPNHQPVICSKTGGLKTAANNRLSGGNGRPCMHLIDAPPVASGLRHGGFRAMLSATIYG
jgi:hypothetical protein